MIKNKALCGSGGGIATVITLLVMMVSAATQPSVARAEMIDRIIASVNDDIIMLSDLNNAMKPYVLQIKAAGYSLSRERDTLFKLRAEFLQKLIESKLADQEAQKYMINVTEEDVDNTIKRLMASRNITDEMFHKQLRDTGITETEYRQTVLEQIMRSRLVNKKIKSRIVVTREDTERYYKENPEAFAGEKKYHLRNIIIPFSGAASQEERNRMQDEMDGVYRELQAGADFVEMVHRHSRSKNAGSGGDLGVLAPEVLAPPIREALHGLSNGEFTPVVKTSRGLQIFYVEEVIATPGSSFEDSVARIQEILRKKSIDERYRTWIEELKTRAHIEIIQ